MTEKYDSAEFAAFRCFACAPESINPLGLHLRFEKLSQGAATDFAVAEHFQSFPGFMHGGIVAAVLDETMAYSIVLHLHRIPWTKTLEVSYRRGVDAKLAHRCESTLVRHSDSEAEATAVLKSPSGRTVASAKAKFTLPSFVLAKKMMPALDLEPYRYYFAESPAPQIGVVVADDRIRIVNDTPTFFFEEIQSPLEEYGAIRLAV